MKTKNILNSLLVAFLFVGTMIAQGNLISAKEFKALQKNNENVTVIDASKAKLYAKSHLDGAISVPYKILNQKEGAVKGLLKSPEELATILGKKGISDQDMIVVYDEGSQKYSTRVFWILKYLGAPNVKILHKENNAWRDARLKLKSSTTSVKTKTFTPNVNKDMVADIAFIKANADAIVLLDARSNKEYTGADDAKKKYSIGHLPGAIHMNEKTIKNENKSFLSATDFASVIAENGFTADKTYVTYCKTGVKASVLYVFLTEVLGYKNVKVYEGSYLEWAAQGENVVK